MTLFSAQPKRPRHLSSWRLFSPHMVCAQCVHQTERWPRAHTFTRTLACMNKSENVTETTLTSQCSADLDAPANTNQVSSQVGRVIHSDHAALGQHSQRSQRKRSVALLSLSNKFCWQRQCACLSAQHASGVVLSPRSDPLTVSTT